MARLLFHETFKGVEVKIDIAQEGDDSYMFKVSLIGNQENFKEAFRTVVPRVHDAGQRIFGVHNWLLVDISEFIKDPDEGTVLKIWSRSYPPFNVISRLFEANTI